MKRGVARKSVLGRWLPEIVRASQLPLVTGRLPFFDGIYWVDKHHDVQG
jgi:hypothetical protein